MQNALPLVTIAIAVYGAILGTLGFALSVWLGIQEIRRYKPRVKVIPSQGRLIDAKGENSEFMALIEAINSGSGPINITGVGWLLHNKKRLQFVRPYMLPLPAELKERKKLTFYFPARWFAQLENADKIVGAFFRDETGNTWKCRIRRKMLQEWRAPSAEGWLLEWDPNLQMYFRKDSPDSPPIPIPG